MIQRMVVAGLCVLAIALTQSSGSRAAIIPTNGYCTDTTTGYIVACPPSPTALPATPVPPVKTLAVSAGVPGPAGTTAYRVTITSSEGCVALPEPTLLYLSGNAHAAALYQTSPLSTTQPGPPFRVFPDANPASPTFGTAVFALEVFGAAVGPAGLAVSAVWPEEGVTRHVVILPAATPTATVTPTTTARPSGTAPPSPTAGATLSPTPTATIPPATPGGSTTPLSVAACFQPNIVRGASLGGSPMTLFGLATPGASCSGQVLYLNGYSPTDLAASSQVAGAAGQVAFPFTEDTSSDGGIGRIHCRLNGETQSACSGFLALQTGDEEMAAADRSRVLQSIIGIVQNQPACGSLFGGS